MPSLLSLPTKLHVPAPRIQLVDRPHLWDRLDAGAESPLTVLTAPAGSGKTVTLATWVRERVDPADAAWVTLEAAENDPVRFWAYVLDALRIVDPALVTDASRHVRNVGRDPSGLVAALVGAIADRSRPVVVALDDYHWISDESVHRSLDLLVDHLPPIARLVVASRSVPPLSVPTRRVRGQLTEIGQHDLRFSADEVEALLAGLRADVDPETLDRLLETTEGWAAGVYLAGLSLREHPDASGFVEEFARMESQAFDFLAGEVLERQPLELQDFLRQTSILTQLSSELCDEVRAATGSQRLLEAAEQANLFLIPLDAHRRWYRYHLLFRELLRRELEITDPGLSFALHRRAGAWHAEHGNVDAAIDHLTAARSYTEAVDLIVANARVRFHSGQWVTVQRWIDALPASVVADEPRLALSMGWANFVGGMLLAAIDWAEKAAEGDPSLVIPGDELTVGAEVLLLRALARRADGDFEGARTAAIEACELTGTSRAPRRFVARAALGMAEVWSGQLTAARADLEVGLPHFARHRDRLALAELMTLGHLAVIELHAGALEEARAHCDGAIALAREREIDRCHLTATARAVAGRLATRAGAWQDATAALDDALALATAAGDPAPIAYVQIGRAEYFHSRGASADAQAAIRAARRTIQGQRAPGIQAWVDEAAAALRRPWAGQALTERELELLRLLPTALSRREIGESLYISVETVKTHTRSLFRKLGVTNRADAVVAARDLGLLGEITQGE